MKFYEDILEKIKKKKRIILFNTYFNNNIDNIVIMIKQ